MRETESESGGWRLAVKFIALISLLFIILGGILSWFFLTRTKGLLEEGLKLRGLAITKNLAFNSTYPLSVESTESLNRLIAGVKGEADVAYVTIMNTKGRVLSHTDPAEIGRVATEGRAQEALAVSRPTVTFYQAPDGQAVYEAVAPVLLASEEGGTPEKIGVVRVGLSSTIMKERLRKILFMGGFLTLAVVGSGIAVAFFFVRLIVAPLYELAGGATKISQGDFTGEVRVESRDEVGVLATAFATMSGGLRGMITKIRNVADDVVSASEHLSFSSKRVEKGAQLQAASTEETASSVEEMNTAIKEIAESTEALSMTAEETSSSLLEMAASTTEVANSAVNLSSSVEETAASTIEMAASIKEVAEHADHLSSSAEETVSAVTEINASVREIEAHAKESAKMSERVMADAQELGMTSISKTIEEMKKIQGVVDETVAKMAKLGERSEQVGKILTVIDEVTKQTNLLALNAAILAAQAGEHGKGFAVVAEEIKNLADRTSASTKEIDQLITNVQTEVREAVGSIRAGSARVEEGVRLSEEAGQALKAMLEGAERSAEMARSIEKATMEQAKGIRQVTEAVQKMNEMVRQIARATQEQSKGSELISRATERMRELTRQVKGSTEEQATGSKQIARAVENVTERVALIARAIKEQRKGSERVMASILEIRQVAQENVKLAGEMGKAVETLMQQGEDLKAGVGRFRV